MNIKTIILSLFLGIFCSATAQITNEAKSDGYNGSVQKVTSTMYEAIVEGNNIERGDILERLQTLYNSKGQRRSMTYLATEEDVIFRTRYKHDGFGITILEQVVDNKEEIIGRTYYVYDANHILTEIYVEDAERQVETRTLISYDDQGRVRQRSFNDALNNVFRREAYTYNPDGTILKTVVYDNKNNKISETRFEYDDHKQPITQTMFDYTEEETELFVTLYKYQYDGHGNWVQRTEFEVNGSKSTPTYIIERSIQYF